MTPTDEQIAEALWAAENDFLGDRSKILASALRAAQERIKQMEAKTVPEDMLIEIGRDYHAKLNGRRDWEGFSTIANRHGYTVTESKEEEHGPNA